MEETIKIIQLLKKIKPELKIILGGPEVSYDVTYWLKRLPEVDCIVMGEGEGTFKELMHRLHANETIENVAGIAYEKDGKMKINPERKKIDLRERPSPYRFPEDVNDYSKRTVYIETSRGCPFNCQFCLSSLEVGIRYFKRDKVKDDLRYLMANGAKQIKFIDRTFNISRSYAMEIFQFLIDEHEPGCVFQFEITADIMRPEVIEFLNKNAPKGLFRFEIGVQSTNDHTNELVKRRQNFEKLSRTVRMIKEGGKVIQHLDLIAGLPEEDYNSFRKTFNDVFAMRPEELQLGFLKLLRGTGLRLNAKQWDYVYMDDAPYEIVGNNVLSFDDIIKIKQVEDILVKYWNDHRMDETIEFLVTECFETPFDFFQEYGSFWAANGWAKIGHQLEDLFLRLEQFLNTKKIKHQDICLTLMKYDFLSKQKFKPRKIWWTKTLSKAEKRNLYEESKTHAQLPDHIKSLSEREWIKRVFIEKSPIDIERYLREKNIVSRNSYMIFIMMVKETVNFIR